MQTEEKYSVNLVWLSRLNVLFVFKSNIDNFCQYCKVKFMSRDVKDGKKSICHYRRGVYEKLLMQQKCRHDMIMKNIAMNSLKTLSILEIIKVVVVNSV